MPRGDGTGPLGFGPMTGRGMGYCAGFPVPGYMAPRWGLRRGRGFRGMYWLWQKTSSKSWFWTGCRLEMVNLSKK